MLAVSILALLTTLSACGGGGGGGGGGSTEVSKGPATGATGTGAGLGAGAGAASGDGRAPIGDTGGKPSNSAPVTTGGETSTPGAVVVGGNTSAGGSTTPPTVSTAKQMGALSSLLSWPVVSIHTAITPDGRLFTFGTQTSARNDYVFYYDVWDSALGTGAASHTTLANTTGTYIFCGSVIASPLTGKVLVNGGDVLGPDNRVTNEPSPDINLFDPATSTLTRSSTLRRPRWYSTSMTMMDGNIFVQGGKGGNDYAEIVNGDGVSVKLVDGWNNDDLDNNYPRNWITPTGKIYGFDAGWPYLIDLSANGGRGARTKLPDQWLRGWAATSSAAMYEPGHIVVVGGADPRITHVNVQTDSPVVSPGPDLPETRQWVSSTVLPDGMVFISGGTEKNPLEDQPDNRDVGNVPYHTYLYDPQQRRLTRTAPLTQIRTYHSTAILLPDASVLTTGGGEPGPVTNLNAEIFYPPYLYNADGSPATRPTISSAPFAADPGSSFGIVTPQAADISTVVLMKTGAVTHSNDMEQRRVPVSFERTAGGLTLQLPANRFLTPPGYYMIFAIDNKGVPSVAKIIRINVGA